MAAVALVLVASCSPVDTDAPQAESDQPPQNTAPSEPSDPSGDPTPEPDAEAPSDDDPTESAPSDDPESAPTAEQDDSDPEPPPPPDGRDALIEHAERMLAAAVDEADTGELAVLVVDEHGREIVSHAADDALLPASTLKTVTAAAILTTFGPRHRISTTVETTAPIGADGVVDGDLVLVGNGDPVLATPEYGRWVYPARPRTPLEDIADRLVEAGVTRIEGDLWASAPGFSGARVPDGWPDRYFSSFDARYSEGLTVDAGLETIVDYPEPDDEDGAEDGTDDTDADTADDADGDATGEERDDPDAEPADELPEDPEELGPPEVTVDHADGPALQAASELIRLLEERDVEVVGEPTEGEPDVPIVGRLATVESPPMLDLLRFTLHRSDNHLADGLFRLAGQARTGDGSFVAGERAMLQVLERHGVDHSDAAFADGSGLSRDDRASARLLVELDRAMTASRHGEAWASIMASMGESGTLRDRLRGTVAEGRFRGKTGTLRDVTALNGTVVDDDGARYHLAVIANDAGVTRGVARVLTDELILLLAADVAGCATDRPGDEDSLIGLPALEVAC